MPLFRLIYFSRAIVGLHEGDIETILASSHRNNQDADVSGLLLYADERFMQVLEGPRAAVNQTLTRVVRDHRHYQINVINAAAIHERRFLNGWMGYATDEAALHRLLAQHTGMQRFDPDAMSCDTALAFLTAIQTSLDANMPFAPRAA